MQGLLSRFISHFYYDILFLFFIIIYLSYTCILYLARECICFVTNWKMYQISIYNQII